MPEHKKSCPVFEFLRESDYINICGTNFMIIWIRQKGWIH